LSVAAQDANPASLLHKVRHLIHWRQQQPALVNGELSQLDVGNAQLIGLVREYQGTRLLVVLNMTGDTQQATVNSDLVEVDGHGFTATLNGQTLTLPAYQAFYAKLS
jgi:alpha-glucosidase